MILISILVLNLSLGLLARGRFQTCLLDGAFVHVTHVGVAVAGAVVVSRSKLATSPYEQYLSQKGKGRGHGARQNRTPRQKRQKGTEAGEAKREEGRETRRKEER